MVFSHCTTEFSRKSQQTDFCQGPGQTAGEKQDLRIRRSGVRRSRRPPGTGAQESTHPSKGAPQFSHSFGVLPEAGAGGMPPQTLAAEGSAGGRPPLGRRGLCRTPRFRAGPPDGWFRKENLSFPAPVCGLYIIAPVKITDKIRMPFMHFCKRPYISYKRDFRTLFVFTMALHAKKRRASGRGGFCRIFTKTASPKSARNTRRRGTARIIVKKNRGGHS